MLVLYYANLVSLGMTLPRIPFFTWDWGRVGQKRNFREIQRSKVKPR